MKRHFLFALSLVLMTASLASAESWVFQQSYYSHDPVNQVRIGRQYASGPVYTRPRGQYTNSGWRYNRSTIQVGGQTYDNTNMYEGWFQVGAQF